MLSISCEEEQLIQEDLNLVQKENLQTFDGDNISRTNSIENHNFLKEVKMNNMEIEAMLSDLGIINPFETDGILIVYVDYSKIADDYSEEPISMMSQSDSLEEFINNYESIMGSTFTIFNIIESTSCDYIYKWFVLEEEYYNYFDDGGNPVSTGENKVIQKPRTESNQDEPIILEYDNCF